MKRFSDNNTAALEEYGNLQIPCTNTDDETDYKVNPNTLMQRASGLPLRELSLLDLFGTTDPQTAIAYAVSQREAVAEGDYVDLAAFSFTDDVTSSSVSVTTTGNNSRIRVAANPSTYYLSGDTSNTGTVLWEFANCPFLRAMNSSGSNSGDYYASELRTVLNSGFYTGLQEALGSSNTIKATRRLLATGDTATAWAWYTDYCWVPTEVEVFGCKNVGVTPYQLANSFQFPIYSKTPCKRIKYYNGSRYWWWLSTTYKYATNASYFAYVATNGVATWNAASYSAGVSPAFVI